MGQWPKYLKEYQYESIMICRNNYHEQQTWCKENDYITSSNDIEFEIVAEQTARFKPDILFIFGASYFATNNRLGYLLDKVQSVRKTVCWYGAPETNINIFKDYDLVLTNSYYLRDKIHKHNIHSEQINHAFEPKTIRYINNTVNRINQICFIGSMLPYNSWHQGRIKSIQKLASSIDVQLYCDLDFLSLYDRFKRKYIDKRHQLCKILHRYFPENKIFTKYSNINILPQYQSFIKIPKKSLHNPLYGLQMYQELSKYLVSFNNHIQETGDYACNMRLFEATGVGCCLLTDHKKEIVNLFKIDNEIVTYKTNEEAIDKAKYLLQNPTETLAIGQAGQKKTMLKHNTHNQVNHLSELLSIRK